MDHQLRTKRGRHLSLEIAKRTVTRGRSGRAPKRPAMHTLAAPHPTTTTKTRRIHEEDRVPGNTSYYFASVTLPGTLPLIAQVLSLLLTKPLSLLLTKPCSFATALPDVSFFLDPASPPGPQIARRYGIRRGARRSFRTRSLVQ